MTEQQDILDFWFGQNADRAGNAAKQKKLWYRSRPATDDKIRVQFAKTHTLAADGKLEDWRTSAQGSLALVILLDQFSRHLFRGTGKAFACDANALNIASTCPAPDTLSLLERAFLYHPYKHAECLETQTQSLQLFAALVAAADDEWRPMMTQFQYHAEAHFAIVKRFGRFPHRNVLLGRANTAAEHAYLAENARSFGQRAKKTNTNQ